MYHCWCKTLQVKLFVNSLTLYMFYFGNNKFGRKYTFLVGCNIIYIITDSYFNIIIQKAYQLFMTLLDSTLELKESKNN